MALDLTFDEVLRIPVLYQFGNYRLTTDVVDICLVFSPCHPEQPMFGGFPTMETVEKQILDFPDSLYLKHHMT